MSQVVEYTGEHMQVAIRPPAYEVDRQRSTSVPTEHEMMVYHTMAEQAVSSKMYKGMGEKAGVMMIMLSARELGIPPMQALNGGINIINGKVEISARMMNATIRRAGHQITVKESTDIACTLHGRRCDTNESLTTSFTIAEAQKAGLVKPGGGWTKWPKDMCFARALSRLARQLFSDVIGIGYVEGEIKPSDAEVITIEEPENIQESENTWMERYLTKFETEDHIFAMQYLRLVQNHFAWAFIETIKKVLADEKLLEKFTSWKNKLTTEEKK